MIEDIINFIETNNTIIDGIANIICIVGGVLGCIGWFIARITRKKMAEYESVIHKLEAENAQIAKTINNNYGLSYRDTKDLASDVVDDKTKHMSRFFTQETEPKDAKNDDMWIGGTWR